MPKEDISLVEVYTVAVGNLLSCRKCECVTVSVQLGGRL